MTIKPALTAAMVGLAAFAWSPTTYADDTAALCAPEQLVVTALPMQAGVSHRGVPLVFTLAPGASPCTLTGYPGVDSGTGGPLLHARRTLRGYLGGLPSGVDIPPTVTVAPGHPAQAMVEGVAVDADTNQCPTYTDLLVTAPDTTGTVTVPATIDTCDLQVHPVTATAEPATVHPCDWVSAEEASAVLGAPVQTTSWGDEAGSTDMFCAYTTSTSDTGLQSDLRLPQAFPGSAAAQFAKATSAENSTPVEGLGVAAQCVYEPTTTPPSTTVVVLLSGDRLYRATSWYGTSCDQLRQFAQFAIGRIGA
jgi:type IV pilus biogenesis protein CpaD/CtpE